MSDDQIIMLLVALIGGHHFNDWRVISRLRKDFEALTKKLKDCGHLKDDE